MKTMPLATAKATLSQLVKRLGEDAQEIIITKNGKPAAVLISPEEFENFRETAEILANPELMSDIAKGVRELKSGKAKVMTVDELFGKA